jgi:hypothetical protein
MSWHRMYGLLIETEVPYGPDVEPDGEPDWRVRWAPGDVDLDVPPPGQLVVDRAVWPVYSDGDVFALWSERFGRFDLHVTERMVSIALAKPQLELASLYMRGVIMSLALELTGLSVLHANSMLVDDRAVAFIGQRGAGKTTVTTALHAAGLPLLADDVVPIERLADGWTARSGYTDLRLRPTASSMLELFASAVRTSTSIDGRTVLHLDPPSVLQAALGGIVVPAPSSEHAGPVRITSLTGREALVQLLGGFRVHNFLEPRLAARRLEVVSHLIGNVPIGRLEMPVRERWTHDDAQSVRHAVESWQRSVG